MAEATRTGTQVGPLVARTARSEGESWGAGSGARQDLDEVDRLATTTGCDAGTSSRSREASSASGPARSTASPGSRPTSSAGSTSSSSPGSPRAWAVRTSPPSSIPARAAAASVPRATPATAPADPRRRPRSARCGGRDGSSYPAGNRRGQPGGPTMVHVRTLATSAALALAASVLATAPAHASPPYFETITEPISNTFEDFCGEDGLTVDHLGPLPEPTQDPNQQPRGSTTSWSTSRSTRSSRVWPPAHFITIHTAFIAKDLKVVDNHDGTLDDHPAAHRPVHAVRRERQGPGARPGPGAVPARHRHERDAERPVGRHRALERSDQGLDGPQRRLLRGDDRPASPDAPTPVHGAGPRGTGPARRLHHDVRLALGRGDGHLDGPLPDL